MSVCVYVCAACAISKPLLLHKKWPLWNQSVPRLDFPQQPSQVAAFVWVFLIDARWTLNFSSIVAVFAEPTSLSLATEPCLSTQTVNSWPPCVHSLITVSSWVDTHRGTSLQVAPCEDGHHLLTASIMHVAESLLHRLAPCQAVDIGRFGHTGPGCSPNFPVRHGAPAIHPFPEAHEKSILT